MVDPLEMELQVVLRFGILGTKPGSIARAASALRAISLAPTGANYMGPFGHLSDALRTASSRQYCL